MQGQWKKWAGKPNDRYTVYCKVKKELNYLNWKMHSNRYFERTNGINNYDHGRK